MQPEETVCLTRCMADSGDRVDLSAIAGVKADKHSTGGVGDKTTLVCAPLVAACGVKIAKMSGRGLGHTGGTVDKLEAIPGMRMELGRQAFIGQVNAIGIAVVGQSGNLAPADKKIYALRDVTATVGSLPLIASSIMSKKLAAGCDVVLLDVKTGTGALMKDEASATELARQMVAIGEAAGMRTAALITNMDIPLGVAIGNSAEVAEAVQTLRGAGPADLTEVCLELAAGMLHLAGLGNREACLARAKAALQDGSGLQKLRQMVEAQGGDAAYIDDPGRFPAPAHSLLVRAPRAGFVGAMDTEQIGRASVVLGAGRQRKEDTIDYAAYIKLYAKTGSRVAAGDVLAELAANDETKLAPAAEMFAQAVQLVDTASPARPLIVAQVGLNL